MNLKKRLNAGFGKAICYSGFREGQSPETGIFPTYEEIKEDLLILQNHWKFLRLYDCDKHSEIVLEVIENENLNFKVMLGAYIVAEVNNFGCPWGGTYSEDQLIKNKEINLRRIQKLIKMANQYPEIIFSLSAGNEACVDWTDHYVPVKSVINYVKMIKKGAGTMEEERIIDIESKLAYQEYTLKGLNEVILEQQKQIDDLMIQINNLNNRVKELTDNTSFTAIRDEKPPHY